MKFKKMLISLIAILVCSQSLCVFGNASYDNVYYSHKNSQMKIALTFDDGPHPRYTPKILDILKKYDVKATFFVIGENAHYYSDALCRAAKEGHEIANHTYSHVTFSRDNLYKLQDEIFACENEIYGLIGSKTKLFRPPEGLISNQISSMANALDYDVILWDIDTKDWAHTPPERIADNVVQNIKSGDVILMHDFIGERSPTPEALELFIPILLKKGYKFVTVSELIGTSE